MKQTMKTISVIALLIGSLNASALDKASQGAVIGAVAGGVIGNQIGGGSGKAIATGLGVIIGAAVGSSIGEALDRADQMAIQDAEQQALLGPVNSPVGWDGARYGSRSGAYGNFVSTRHGHHRRNQNEMCRSYRSEIYTRNQKEVRSGTTCRRADGSWYEVRSSEVVFY